MSNSIAEVGGERKSIQAARSSVQRVAVEDGLLIIFTCFNKARLEALVNHRDSQDRYDATR